MSNPTGKGGFGEHPEYINRSGRPKDTFSPLLQEKYGDSENVRMLVDKLHELAAGGNLQALIYLCDRFIGKPRQSMELTGEGEVPIQIQIVRHGDTPDKTT